MNLNWITWGVGIVIQLVALHYALKMLGQAVIYLVMVYS